VNWFIGVVVAIVAGILAVQAVLAWRWPPDRRRILVGSFAGQRSLVLDAEAAALAERLLIAGRKGRFVGAGASVVVILGIWLVVGPRSGLVASTAFLVVHNAGGQVAAAVVSAVAMRRATRRDAGDGPRYAHLPPTSLDDVLPPLMRWWSVGLLGLAAVGVGACLALGVDVSLVGRRDLVLGLAASAATVGAAEIAARFLARAPLSARSPAALAVCDEIRSDLASVVLAGMVGPLLLCGYLVTIVIPGAGTAVFLLVLPIAAIEKQRRRRVRERLWAVPPLGAGGRPPADAAL
jgi:hypothetical protein